MRAFISGTTLTIDLIHSRDDVLRIVDLALTAGLSEIEVHTSGDRERGLTITVAPTPGVFAAEPLAGLLYVVAAIQRTTPEKLVENWRTKSGVAVDAGEQAPPQA